MLYGEWDQYIKRVEARLQEGGKLDSQADKTHGDSGGMVATKTLGKRKDRTGDNEEILHAENVPAKHENARARCFRKFHTKGNTQGGLTVKAAQTKGGGGKMTNRELQMIVARVLTARKEGEPVTLQSESFSSRAISGFRDAELAKSKSTNMHCAVFSY